MQIARILTDPFAGFLKDTRYVLIDRDANFSIAFRRILKQADVEPVRLPPRSPNLNSHLERFHLSLKSECLDKMIFFGERSLRNACTEFLTHYHQERNHQGLDNKIIEPSDSATWDGVPVRQDQLRTMKRSGERIATRVPL